MPTLTIIAGPNGSGKTTVTRKLQFEGRENLLNPDAIATILSPGDPQKAAVTAGREVITRTREYIGKGVSFAIETTLASKHTIATMREAQAQGFTVNLIYIALDSPEHQIRRVTERVAMGGHSVPEDDIRRRYHRSLMNASEAIQAADDAVVFDNTGRPYREIIEARHGVVTWRSDNLPAWAGQLLQALDEPRSCR